MAGDWDCEDLTGLLTVFAGARRRPRADAVPAAAHAWPCAGSRPPTSRPRPARAATSAATTTCRTSSSRLFLDETMTYSSALFETAADGSPAAADRLLGQAQRRKIDRLLDQARVGPGAGCSRSAPAGASWRSRPPGAAPWSARSRSPPGSTSSRPAGWPRPGWPIGSAWSCAITVTCPAQYDAICSVEMIEAVGDRYWDTYFAALDQLLAPGGRVALQAITMPHDRMMASRRTYTWILKYIFPGGLIPSVTAIEDSLSGAPGCGSPSGMTSARTTRRRCRSGGTGLTPAGTRSPRSASTRSSSACGCSTCATPRPASAPGT